MFPGLNSNQKESFDFLKGFMKNKAKQERIELGYEEEDREATTKAPAQEERKG